MRYYKITITGPETGKEILPRSLDPASWNTTIYAVAVALGNADGY